MYSIPLSLVKTISFSVVANRNVILLIYKLNKSLKCQVSPCNVVVVVC